MTVVIFTPTQIAANKALKLDKIFDLKTSEKFQRCIDSYPTVSNRGNMDMFNQVCFDCRYDKSAQYIIHTVRAKYRVYDDDLDVSENRTLAILLDCKKTALLSEAGLPISKTKRSLDNVIDNILRNRQNKKIDDPTVKLTTEEVLVYEILDLRKQLGL